MFCPRVSLSVITAQVSRQEVTNFTPPENDLIPHLLEIEWTGEGKPQRLSQKVVLGGTKDSKFLTIRQPTIPIGMCGSNNEEWSVVVDACGSPAPAAVSAAAPAAVPAAVPEKKESAGCCQQIWKLMVLLSNLCYSSHVAVAVITVLLCLTVILQPFSHQFYC